MAETISPLAAMIDRVLHSAVATWQQSVTELRWQLHMTRGQRLALRVCRVLSGLVAMRFGKL